MSATERLVPCSVPVPAGAQPGDELELGTDVGPFKLTVPKRPGKFLSVELPVPEHCKLKSLSVGFVRVIRGGVELRPGAAGAPGPSSAAWADNGSSPTRRVNVLVPAGATAGDTLTVTTEVGNFELAVPADVGRTLFADLPVPPDCQLSTLKVSKLLLNGQELVKAAPPSAAAIGAGGTRRVVVPMQSLPNAQPGHTLALQTEVGVFQVVVPDGWRSWKPLAVDLAVPDDYSAPGLTIAWAKLVDDLSPAALVGSTPPRMGTSPGGRVRYASCPEDPAELGILGTREQVLAAIQLQGAVRAHLSTPPSLRRRGHLFKVQESPAREAAARGGSPAARRAAPAAAPGASWAENWDGPPGLAELCVAMQQVADAFNRSLSRCMAVL